VTDLAYALESFVLFGISVGPAGLGNGSQTQGGVDIIYSDSMA